MHHKLWLGQLLLGSKLHVHGTVPNSTNVVFWGVMHAISCLLIFHDAKVAEDGIFGLILFLDLSVGVRARDVLEPVGGG